MATVKELKATARPQSGKGAARAERRAGRVPGVIYGNNQPPVTISVDDKELRQRILAGRFLTTIYDIDLEGKKHRVIPRDFHLDPVRDFPLHVDFMRLGEGATIRVSVPLHVVNGETSPGVKRGGTVNIVTHTIDLECSVDNIPQYIEADVGTLEISHSLHLSEIKLPAGVKSLSRLPLQARLLRRRVPLRRRLLPLRRVLRLRRLARKRRLAATRRSKQRRDAASCACLSVSVTPVRNTRTTGTTSDSWPSMKSRGVTVSHRGAAVFRARLPMARSMVKRSFCCGRPPT